MKLAIYFKITLIVASLACVDAASWFGAQQDVPQNLIEKNNSTSTAIFLLENSGAFMTILREIFTEVDWKTILKAQVEIEKFISRIERMIKIIRGREGRDGRSTTAPFSGRWWTSTGTKANLAGNLDTTTTKAALEKFACAVGYMKLLDYGNDALAELDASKKVSGLFAASMKNSTSWFG